MRLSNTPARTGRKRRRRDVRSTMGGLLFLSGAFVTALAVVIPHAPLANERGYQIMALAELALGLALLALPARAAKVTPAVAIAAAIVVCAFAVLLNGESKGGATTLNEFFFIWPVLYAGYFFTIRWTAVTLVAIGLTYATLLNTIGVTGGVFVERLFVTMSVLSGTAAAMHSLRAHVDRLMRRLNDLARTDALTGLLNRRAFDERLKAEHERSKRTGEPFALLLADIDHFKAINDEHGHAAGDLALTEVATTIAGEARAIDTVARIGGEEFALILPGARTGEGVEVAERLRLAIKDAGRTICFGVVESPTHGETPDEVLKAADRALYEAKAQGRDRTVAPGETTVQIA